MKIQIQRNRDRSRTWTVKVSENFFELADYQNSICDGNERPEYWAREVGKERWVGFRVDPERAHINEY